MDPATENRASAEAAGAGRLPTGRRILSGVQPSGRIHLGRYYGAMRQHLALQDNNEAYYFIANLHALTSLKDPAEVREYTLEVALAYLAFGLDPDKTVFFRQSDVPEVTELAWFLSTVTPMGLLERCVAYKEKVEQGAPAEHGLFAYPVLQAADILAYRSHLVPVGADQKQHIEVTRDIAMKFNRTYGEVLVIPSEYIVPEAAVVPGLDGRKMSASYGNTIDIFVPDKQVRRQIMSIVTDSTPVEEPKDPDKCNVMALLRLAAPPDEVAQWEDRYRRGGAGYGEAKKRLFELFMEYFGPARQEYDELTKNLDYVEEVLQSGGQRARVVARQVMDDVRRATGIT